MAIRENNSDYVRTESYYPFILHHLLPLVCYFLPRQEHVCPLPVTCINLSGQQRTSTKLLSQSSLKSMVEIKFYLGKFQYFFFN